MLFHAPHDQRGRQYNREFQGRVLATDIEPENARAWAGMASTRLKQAAYGFADTKGAYLEGKKFAEKALALDEGLPEVHEAMGWTLAAFEHNIEGAGRCFKKALELSPNGSRQIMSMSIYYLILGRDLGFIKSDSTLAGDLDRVARLLHALTVAVSPP